MQNKFGIPGGSLATLTLAAAALLSGCAMGVGKSEFSCNGMPSGVQCMSVRDVYGLTEDNDQVTGQAASAETETGGKKKDEAGGEKTGPAANVPKEAMRPSQDPPVPEISGVIPLRTPSGVMRIRLAPWEDGEGDLHVPGYIYTEVEKRRWTLGMPAPESAPVLRPLSSPATSKETAKPERKTAGKDQPGADQSKKAKQ